MAQNGSGECPSLLGFILAKSIVARCRIFASGGSYFSEWLRCKGHHGRCSIRRPHLNFAVYGNFEIQNPQLD